MITVTPGAVFGWGMDGLADVVEPPPHMVAGCVLFLVAMAAYA
jgi:hypothetical protein